MMKCRIRSSSENRNNIRNNTSQRKLRDSSVSSLHLFRSIVIFSLLISMFRSQTLAFQFITANHGTKVSSIVTRGMVSSTTGENGEERRSVTGQIYTAEDHHPVVQLYTKEGCTLCDKVSDTLKAVRDTHPHSLQAVDITDDDKTEWWDRYKWDIPVLHINGLYWTKHRLTSDEAIQALESSSDGTFTEQKGQPNAAAMERK